MSIVHWHPFKELNNLRHQMNSLFEEMMHGERSFDFNLFNDRLDLGWTPAVALTETDTELLLKVELPGIEAKDLDIRVDDRMVAIAGERKEEKHHQEKGHLLTEFSYGKFQRIVSLPIAINKHNIKADLNNGLLTLTMTKNMDAISNPVKVDLLQTKAREALSQKRQEVDRQQETMHLRVMEELKGQDNSIEEETRELMVEQRQHQKQQQENMHSRTSEEMSSTS